MLMNNEIDTKAYHLQSTDIRKNQILATADTVNYILRGI